MKKSIRSDQSRPLTRDEIRIWSDVAKTVKMHKRAILPKSPAEDDEMTSVKSIFPEEQNELHQKIHNQPTKISQSFSSLRTSEPKLYRRLQRGQVEVDNVLDLHGCNQKDAHQRLLLFLKRSVANNLQIVLVITGKGRSSSADTGRGILRRSIPHWLQAMPIRNSIVSFEIAGVRHGGEGAIYIRLQRGWQVDHV